MAFEKGSRPRRGDPLARRKKILVKRITKSIYKAKLKKYISERKNSSEKRKLRNIRELLQ